MSVKVYQHTKAIGNARKMARAGMFYIFRDATGQDVVGGADTAYGPERQVLPETIVYDGGSGEGIIAVGRLEMLSADAVEGDVRLVNKEAYTLYWLPFAWAWPNGDYHHNPQSIGSEMVPTSPTPSGADFMPAGSRVWIVLDTDDYDDLSGKLAWEFVVMDSPRLGLSDLVEYQATVIKSEGVLPRTVGLI